MDTQSIGNYIREKRMKNGWTQEQLAEKLEVASKTVSNWENGNFSSIKNENLDKLSKVFQVSVGEIYLGKDMVGLDEESKQILSIKQKAHRTKIRFAISSLRCALLIFIIMQILALY